LLFPRFEYIPRTIISTTCNKKTIPEYILQQYENQKKYDTKIFDDNECVAFLTENYSREVSQKFKDLRLGAHKADLFRYAYLYKYGGCYMDIKTLLTRPLDDIIDHNNNNFYMVQSIHENCIYNGFICTPPKNIFFLDLLNDILRNNDNPSDYHRICRFARQRINLYLSNLVLWREKHTDRTVCPDPDRYGFRLICVNKKEEMMFKIRDPAYGKKWK